MRMPHEPDAAPPKTPDKRLVKLGALFAVMAVAGCQPDRDPPRTALSKTATRIDPTRLDGERALCEVTDFVAIGPRNAGTEGAARAADYLQGKLQDAKLLTSVDVFTAPTPAGPVVFRNVLAERPAGTPVETPPTASFLTRQSGGRIVVLLSHYDTKSGISEDFAGANDSGSSTGLLLEMARVLAAHPTPCHVLLAFVDGEECQTSYGPRDGLHGSRRLASRLRAPDIRNRIAAVIVVDMIGDRDLQVGIPRNSTPALVTTAFDAAEAVGVRRRFTLNGMTILDDHVPFLEAGMPAIDLIDFTYGSAPGLNDYWHTPEDTMDKLSAESLEAVGRTVIAMLNRLCRTSPD